MTVNWGELLPVAVGIAISPVPIAAVILMLFSAKARPNGLAFVAGWIAGLAVVGGLLLALGGSTAGSTDSPSTAVLVVKAVLGALLLWEAALEWRQRPGEGDQPQEPKWMTSIDAFTAWKSFGLAALLSGVNPKNLALNAAGVMVIAQAQMNSSDTWIAFAVFVLIASTTVLAPVVYYLIAGEKAEASLESMKTWLILNNAAVMSVLLLVFGVKLLASGLQGLLS
jgi:hypothetical protein